MSTLHCVLENGADLYVNEHQKIQHYHAGLLKKEEDEEERRMPNRDFFTIIAMLTLTQLKISRRTRWWCLKYAIVYLVREIPAFEMYCVNGASRSSVLIESTDSMIRIYKKI